MRARARELIRELRERIVNGEDFGAIAEEYSNDPGSASRGGDLGYLHKGELVKEMEEFAWEAPIGELSDVIQTTYGFHIAIVNDRHISDIDRLKMQERQKPGDESAGVNASAEGAATSAGGSTE
ncbi:MAG: peptidyl-prolyl cis-trans isomerase [Deltaproteobacteria bacterium]|nr:peptidyl-prolyl cis-trans isomerase [Kofleriaceae bacterium]